MNVVGSREMQLCIGDIIKVALCPAASSAWIIPRDFGNLGGAETRRAVSPREYTGI